MRVCSLVNHTFPTNVCDTQIHKYVYREDVINIHILHITLYVGSQHEPHEPDTQRVNKENQEATRSEA